MCVCLEWKPTREYRTGGDSFQSESRKVWIVKRAEKSGLILISLGLSFGTTFKLLWVFDTLWWNATKRVNITWSLARLGRIFLYAKPLYITSVPPSSTSNAPYRESPKWQSIQICYAVTLLETACHLEGGQVSIVSIIWQCKYCNVMFFRFCWSVPLSSSGYMPAFLAYLFFSWLNVRNYWGRIRMPHEPTQATPWVIFFKFLIGSVPNIIVKDHGLSQSPSCTAARVQTFRGINCVKLLSHHHHHTGTNRARDVFASWALGMDSLSFLLITNTYRY